MDIFAFFGVDILWTLLRTAGVYFVLLHAHAEGAPFSSCILLPHRHLHFCTFAPHTTTHHTHTAHAHAHFAYAFTPRFTPHHPHHTLLCAPFPSFKTCAFYFIVWLGRNGEKQPDRKWNRQDWKRRKRQDMEKAAHLQQRHTWQKQCIYTLLLYSLHTSFHLFTFLA